MLEHDKTHPTTKELYNKVHKIDSSIGQATVYRTVNKLVELGKIKKLSINNDVDHYDGDISNHYHFICNTCNRIIDIFDDTFAIDLDKVNKNINVSIKNYDIILYGECDKCVK